MTRRGGITIKTRRLYEVNVTIQVRADDDEQAWRLVHDFCAYYITGRKLDPYVVDFFLLEEAATEVTDG